MVYQRRNIEKKKTQELKKRPKLASPDQKKQNKTKKTKQKNDIWTEI